MMKKSSIGALIFSATCLVAPLAGADLDVAATAAEKQLADAVAELAKVRERITAEKVPVAGELRALETALIAKRRERDRLQRLHDNAGVETGSLEAQLKAREEEIDFVGNLLNDYANRLNASLHPAEEHLYTEKLLTILNVGEKADLSRTAKLETQADAILIGIDRLKENAGGRMFEGSAVLPGGRFEAGRFALIGPIGFFATNDGSMGGLAERGTATGPRIVVFDPAATPAIAALLKNGSGAIPIDPSEGKAIALASTRESLIEHIHKGGIWMYPIIGFAFVSFFMGVFKFVQIIGFKTPRPTFVTEVLAKLGEHNRIEAERIAKAQPGPAGEMLVEGVRNATVPKELLDELLFEKMLEVKPVLERGLALISVTAAVAPLLGLLGTVTGMINTFKAITVFGTGDAKSLSSGISEALITTEWGLIVAIPALLLSAYLSRRVNGYLAGMERISMNFVNGVSVQRNQAEESPAEPASLPAA
jgi:biopolymer transport protein ExbB